MSSYATMLSAAVAFVLTAALGIFLIPFLRKLKYGQTILDIGPSWHKNKQGTPTMGGLMFIIGISAACCVGYAALMTDPGQSTALDYNKVSSARFWGALLMALGFGFIGFVDDYIKVVKKRNLGLTAGQKLVMQFLVAGVFLGSLYLFGDTSTTLVIPFLGQWNMGVAYYPLAVVGIVFIVNSVNLTDGLDGLSSSVTFVAALGFLALSSLLGYASMSVLSTALAGGTLGFLIWNFYPAKVFMGDTGSMFLGGLVVGIAFGLGMPLILAFLGIIYIVESLSVVLQVISFKTTGKRIFKMSPIHHHFEMCGYSELQIVGAFSLVTLAGAILAVIAVLRM